MKLMDQIINFHTELTHIRRDIHAHPELCFEEQRTADVVAAKLTEWGIPIDRGMGVTGVVGIIRNGSSTRAIGLRADMDALPVQEINTFPHASKHAGKMHACGHDGHVAMLLGAAHYLAKHRNFDGTVYVIFQPAEEVIPGGASLLIKAGVLENPRPQHILGQHVMPELPVGKVGFRAGRYMASNDEISITVKGKGGHGAMPHLGVDPVLIACHMVVALQQIVSRAAQPTIPTVLSFGKVIADGSVNVIPNEVYMEGTFRTLDEQWRTEAHQRMKYMAESIAAGMGGSCDFRLVRGYPCLTNSPTLTGQVRNIAAEYLGEENIVDTGIWMAAEDFAYYAQAADSCFYLLGTGGKTGGAYPSLHTPAFDIDEDALATSTGLMAYIALKSLGN